MHKPNPFQFLTILTLLLFTTQIFAQNDADQEFNCYSVMVGRDASVTGSVMFAHNEDDWGTRMVNWIKVPGKVHVTGEEIILKNGGKVDQVDTTFGYIWLEMPEMDFSDTYMNEMGVTIASDACRSREDKPDLTDGGIGYWLRRLMAERASSAREAIEIGIQLVEKFGYTGSGRSYCIADTEEAWVFAVVNGKHWVAQRVPDHHVMVIPNYYTIGEVNLADTANFLACNDLVKYARERGWYDLTKDGNFSFRKAYAKKSSLEHPGNTYRMWKGVNTFSFKQYKTDDKFPFSFLPTKKVSIFDLMELLRDHYEGTELDLTKNYTLDNPHASAYSTICDENTQYGFVAHLRSYLPIDVGAILWVAPYRPCVHPYIPFYSGITEMPEGYFRSDVETTLQQHFDIPEELYEHTDTHVYWTFFEDMTRIDQDYLKLYKKPKKKSLSFEQKLMQKQAAAERELAFKYKNDPEKIKAILTEYVKETAEDAWNLVKKY